jgi:hypothetical protein
MSSIYTYPTLINSPTHIVCIGRDLYHIFALPKMYNVGRNQILNP